MKTLNGDGRSTSMQLATKNIHIKAGYNGKTRLHFPGEGHQTVHGTVSDLIFCVKEVPHLVFKRQGDDLIYTHWLKLADAFACCSIDIKTLDGRTISVGVDSLVK
jgi:DnaJ family protein B protein 1